MKHKAALLLCGALFLAAPIGAGITGAAYFAVIPFAGLFLLWDFVMRKTPFHGDTRMVLPAIMTALALASVSIGVGAVLRIVFTVGTTAPLSAWLALGLGALGLGRFLWQPGETAESDRLIEAGLKRLDRAGSRVRPSTAQQDAEVTPKEPEAPGDTMSGAFDRIVAAADTETLAKFLDHTGDLLDTDPSAWPLLPGVDRLIDIANQIESDHPDLSERLVELAERIENLEREGSASD
ncbi:hypothetical protein [Tropicimonas sp.]|uniref:hypothetical protein n=1 Tax=Tropicimonas sp. TaxID=2067044 RepID=UPI003A88D1C1